MSKAYVEVERSGWGVTAKRYAIAIRATITALGSLDFEGKRRVIRFVCELFAIDPTRL